MANVGYFAVLPMSIIASSETIALVIAKCDPSKFQDFGSTLFGSAGGIVFAICVAASCFGALNATTFTTARLIYVAGRERLLPAMFGELHPKRMTPVKALLLQAVLTSLMVIVGDFSGLVMFYGVVGWSWYFVLPR
jgi:amino acid transporter